MADKDDKVLERAKSRFRLSHDHWSENRNWYEDDNEFGRLGEQWPEKYRAEREAEGRPCLTINRIPSFVRQITNDARQNKPQIRVRPADSNADPKTAEIYNGLVRNIEVTSDSDVAYDTALECAVYGGFGFFRIDTEYATDDTFDLDIVYRRIANPLTVYPDPATIAADASDWRFCFVTEMIPVDEYERRFGKSAPQHDWSSDGESDDELWFDATEKRVRIAEYWEREEIDREIVLLSNGQVLDKAQFEEQADLWLAQGVDVVDERTTPSHKVCHYLLSGDAVLEETDWPGKYIPVVPVYGNEVIKDGKRYFTSLTREVRDAQLNYNYWRTSSTELVALAPKAPYIGPQGAFNSDMGKWQTAHVKSHPFIEYDGAIPPQRQPFAGVPAGAIQEALNASDDMKAILGIYDASLGARSNETSGKAILARQREGDISTFHYIDNLSRAIRYAGRVLLDLIPSVYSKPRIVRVLGEDGEPKTVPVNQPDPTGNVYELARGKYDLVVDTGPGFTTRREETNAFLTEVMRANPATAPLLMDVVARNLDFPEAEKIAGRFKAMLPPPIQAMESQGDNGPDAAAMAAQLAQAQAQMQAMQQQLQQAAQAIQGKQMEVAANEREAQAELQLERAKSQAELALERQRAEAMLQLEREKAAAKVQLEREIAQMKIAAQQDIEMMRQAAETQRAALAAMQPQITVTAERDDDETEDR